MHNTLHGKGVCVSIHTEAKGAIRYSPAGTLPKPGVVGRVVRGLLGILCLSLVADVMQASSPAVLGQSGWWMVMALGLLLVNYVVNLGFGLSAKNLPVILSALLIGGAAEMTYAAEATLVGNPLFPLNRL